MMPKLRSLVGSAEEIRVLFGYPENEVDSGPTGSDSCRDRPALLLETDPHARKVGKVELAQNAGELVAQLGRDFKK